MVEPVLYTLNQVKKRVLIPKVITIIILSAFFYIGIIINIWLIDLSDSVSNIIKIGAVIILIILSLTEIAVNIHKVKQNYYFYQNRITFKDQQIFLSGITDIQVKRNWLDKLFKTQSVILNQQFKISFVPFSEELKNYLWKLVDYSKKS